MYMVHNKLWGHLRLLCGTLFCVIINFVLISLIVSLFICEIYWSRVNFVRIAVLFVRSKSTKPKMLRSISKHVDVILITTFVVKFCVRLIHRD